MPAALARAALASLRPASEVMTRRPRSTSRAPTPAPMAPCATIATVGFMRSLLAVIPHFPPSLSWTEHGILATRRAGFLVESGPPIIDFLQETVTELQPASST